MELEKYKWVVRENKIEHLLGNNQLEQRTVITIGVQNKKNGIIVPHPITHFIKENYEFKGKSISAQINPARKIVGLLNFINEQIIIGKPDYQILHEKGFRGLQLKHGAQYITHCSERKLAYDYVRGSIERYLIHFYNYLKNMELIDEEIVFDTYISKKGEEVIISPFLDPTLDTQYPSTDRVIKNKLKDFGDIPEKRNKLVYEFIEEARKVMPDIAFGIALQFFGGLRRGEVVNLTAGSIPTDFLSGSNYVAVLDNQHILFRHLQNTTKEQVKRARMQPILPSLYLKELYDAHIKMNMKIKKMNPHAFFVDSKGRTISGGTYEKKFGRVKETYLERLNSTQGRYSDWNMLRESIWGTHIGRGVFTNFLYNRGLDDKQMAIARGDRSTESAKEYIDYRNAISNFQMAIETLSSEEIVDVGKTMTRNWNWEVFSK